MHPELLSMSLFMFVTSCSPGPNNIVASYSGFNFGLTKTIPHMCGVIFGFTTLVIVVNFGLISVFKNFPIIQEILKYGGTIFLIYLAYKISFSKTSSGSTSENPVKFIETFFGKPKIYFYHKFRFGGTTIPPMEFEKQPQGERRY